MMKDRKMIRFLLIGLLATGLVGCGEESNDQDRINATEELSAEEFRDEAGDFQSGMSNSNIKIDQGRLQINTVLLVTGQPSESLVRFAEIVTDEPIYKIQARVFIDKTIFSGAVVHVGLELAYQSSDYKNDRTNQTLVKNQFSFKQEGFRLSSMGLGCKNKNCSLFYQSSIAEGENYPVNQVISVADGHTLSLEWDAKNFGFIFRFNNQTGFLNMADFIHESGFDPEIFSYARLFASIRSTESTKESNRVLARFGDVYVNDVLFDDFQGTTLDSEKWRTGELYR